MDRAGQLQAAALMGFVALLLLGIAAFALLRAFGLPRPLWTLGGAALMLGATGYALQGRPLQPASPARGAAEAVTDDAALITLRDTMLGRFTGEAAYVVASDALLRADEPRGAVRFLLSGINRAPHSVLLWTALGNALAIHDGGHVSPTALFAFRQAARLAPDHPAPPFFLGVAYVRDGNFAAAQPLWRRALQLSPPTASYRGEIAYRLVLLDRLLAMPDAVPPTSATPR